jgi:Ca2+-binding EF-hand superfamily protein
MFDEDGNGELSVAEVEAMFMRIAKVAEGGVLSDDTKADTKEVIRQIFLRFDTDKVPRASLPLHNNANPSSSASSHFLLYNPNQSGSLSLEEFQAGFAADPAICRYFKQF